jgi:hypothetical protein
VGDAAMSVDWPLFGEILIFISAIFSLVTLENISYNAMDLSCQKIGYIKNGCAVSDISTCADAQGNLYYVEQDCNNNIFDYKCSAKQISIGDVRMAGGKEE